MSKFRSSVKGGGKALPPAWRPKSKFEPKGSKAPIKPVVFK